MIPRVEMCPAIRAIGAGHRHQRGACVRNYRESLRRRADKDIGVVICKCFEITINGNLRKNKSKTENACEVTIGSLLERCFCVSSKWACTNLVLNSTIATQSDMIISESTPHHRHIHDVTRKTDGNRTRTSNERRNTKKTKHSRHPRIQSKVYGCSVSWYGEISTSCSSSCVVSILSTF